LITSGCFFTKPCYDPFMNKKSWFGLGAGLLAVWALAAFLLLFVRQQRTTADKVATYLQSKPIASLTPTARAKFLSELTDQVNRLEFEERQKLRLQRALEPIIQELTPVERMQFVEATLPQGFRQLMDSLNKMTPDQRKRFVQKGLSDLQDAQNRTDPARLEQVKQQFDDGTVQRFIQQGFQSYLENASAETKLDLTPLLEQIQVNLQGLRPPS
jgi:hypothetical protein